MRTFAILTAAVLATTAAAQEAPKPAPEFAVLKKLEGTWTTTMNFGGMESKGTTTYKVDLGGLWLTGTLESELFGAKFMGKSLDTYDANKKKYTSFWFDSMGTAPVITEGAYDAAKKTLTMTGEGPGMDGKPQKYKSTNEFKDDDTLLMTMYMGDAKEAAFTVTYKRKK